MSQMTQIFKSSVRSCLHGSHESHSQVKILADTRDTPETKFHGAQSAQVKIRADTRDTPETKFHGAQSAQVYMIIPEIRWSRKTHRKAVVRCTLYSKLLHSLKTSPRNDPINIISLKSYIN